MVKRRERKRWWWKRRAEEAKAAFVPGHANEVPSEVPEVPGPLQAPKAAEYGVEMESIGTFSVAGAAVSPPHSAELAGFGGPELLTVLMLFSRNLAFGGRNGREPGLGLLGYPGEWTYPPRG